MALLVLSNSGADPITVTAGGAVAFNEGSGTDDTLVLADLKSLVINATGQDITLPHVDGTATTGNDDGTDITINAGSGNSGGTVTLESIDNDVNDVIITGKTIILNGNITTANYTPTGGDEDLGSIDLNGSVQLGADITLTTANGAVGATAPTGIDFDGTINSKASTKRTLELVSNKGAVSIGGTIGADLALAGLTINSSGSGTISIADIGGSGATAYGVDTAATLIGNTDTHTLTLTGTTYKTDTAQTYSADRFVINSGGSTGTTSITTTNDNVSFVDGASTGIVLGTDSYTTSLSIDTGSSGIIDIAPQIKGVAGDDNSNVTLDAGGGSIVLDNSAEVIGTDIGTVNLTGATIAR